MLSIYANFFFGLGWGLIYGYPTILIPGLQGKSGDNSTGHAPEFDLSDEQISWLGSINLLCVPIGSLASGLLMESLGKRRMMQVCHFTLLPNTNPLEVFLMQR